MKRSVSSLTVILLLAFCLIGSAENLSASQPEFPTAVEWPAIVWSQAQQPKPIPSVKPELPDQQPEQAPPNNSQATPAKGSDSERKAESSGQTFSGIIVRTGTEYVLKTMDNVTYHLDDQDRAKRFEGKQVKVTGTVNANTKVIRVQNIEEAA
jgi:Protein of unknown function (DUF5818)